MASDCTLYAKGYSIYPISVPVTSIDFGMRIIATEDAGRDNRIMYPMQAQQDSFSITAIFAMSADRDWFNHWIWGYVSAASVPGSRTALPMRVVCLDRDFDFKGIPVGGWSHKGAPVALGDTTWPITIQFDGAAPTVGTVWTKQASVYADPTTKQPADQLFYPSQFYGTGQPGSGPPTDPYAAPKGQKAPALPVTSKFNRSSGQSKVKAPPQSKSKSGPPARILGPGAPATGKARILGPGAPGAPGAGITGPGSPPPI